MRCLIISESGVNPLRILLCFSLRFLTIPPPHLDKGFLLSCGGGRSLEVGLVVDSTYFSHERDLRISASLHQQGRLSSS